VRRFRFSLARLERVRGVRRREARAAVGAAIAELRRRRAALEAAAAALAAAATPRVTIEDARALKEAAAWREELRRAHAEAAEAERVAAAAVAAALRRHTEAARAHRVLERLRERARSRWLRAGEIEERKFLDETHLLRWVRERGAPAGAGARETT
jgi:hypothetical protein